MICLAPHSAHGWMQFDVTKYSPRAVLQQLWSTLEGHSDDEKAIHIKSHLRILVAGGDGTVTWVLGCISDLGLHPAPPVAVLPLGTGNDLSINLGWGRKFRDGCIHEAHIDETFMKYRKALVRHTDFWNLTMTAPDASFYGNLPNPVSCDSSDSILAHGRFWNYLSIGVDAHATYDFHQLRENHPRLAMSRHMNQLWYGIFTCRTGWFCGGARPVHRFAKVRIKESPSSSDWKELVVPSTVRAIILLNVQTYGGGRDIWGLKNTKNLATKHFQPPSCHDGLIEVLGFKDAWHTSMVMGELNSSSIHAKRLAQCSAIELTIQAPESRKDDTLYAYMQIDGEPWKQRVPVCHGDKDEVFKISVQHGGTSLTLFNPDGIRAIDQ